MTSPRQPEACMRRALALAARGRGAVEPNPMVGCVLVRDDRIIGEGYHRRWGGAHAEVEALRACRESPAGCDVYVTLEPCSHFGKTPPCADALIAARVGRVVAAIIDPGPHVAGRGCRILRRAGIPVQLGLCADEARALNRPYLKHCAEQRPWVILKWAQSIDGRLATRARRETTISGPAARRLVHRWRGLVDAILVGVDTVLADDPRLTARLVHPRRLAARIVLDSHLRTPRRAQLVRTARDVPLIIACSKKLRGAALARAHALERAGAEILPLPEARGRVSLPALLDALGRRGHSNLLVEGGGRVLGAFLDAGLADEARIFVSPRLIGGRDAPAALDAAGPLKLPASFAPAACRLTRVPPDLLYTICLR